MTGVKARITPDHTVSLRKAIRTLKNRYKDHLAVVEGPDAVRLVAVDTIKASYEVFANQDRIAGTYNADSRYLELKEDVEHCLEQLADPTVSMEPQYV